MQNKLILSAVAAVMSVGLFASAAPAEAGHKPGHKPGHHVKICKVEKMCRGHGRRRHCRIVRICRHGHGHH